MTRKKGSKYWQLNDRDWLYQKYWKEEFSLWKIASIIGCCYATLRYTFIQYKIPRRTHSEARVGEKNPFFGKEHTREAIQMIKNSLKGHTPWNKGLKNCYSEESLKKMKESHEGVMVGEKNPNYGKSLSDETKRKLRDTMEGRHPSFNTRLKMSETHKKLWRDEDHIRKVIVGLNAKPNKLEIKVDKILQKVIPNEFKFNGDFSCGISIGRMIPDFVNINGKKLVIEVFGNHWHEGEFAKESWKRTEFGRKAAYAQFGFECTVLWGSDLKYNAEAFILTKLEEEGAI